MVHIQSVCFVCSFQIQFRKTPIAEDVDMDSLVARTQGYSGAEVHILQLWCMFNTTLSLTVVWQWIGH